MKELIWNIIVLVSAVALAIVGHPVIAFLLLICLLTDFRSNITVKDKELNYDSKGKRRSQKRATTKD